MIGTHNGSFYNADSLFRCWKMRRFAEVDSEILLRLADRAFRDEAPDLERFKRNPALCRGQITAVPASRRRPGTVLVLKGNKPLELHIHRRHRAVLYASDPAFLDAVLAHGTADPFADVATCLRADTYRQAQARLAAEFAACAAQHPDPGKNGAPGGPVYGDLLTFDDPETRLPAIDHLEGFLPSLRAGTHRQAGGPGLYRRVPVPASTRGQRVLVWLYMEGAGRHPLGLRQADGLWQAWERRLPDKSAGQRVWTHCKCARRVRAKDGEHQIS